MSLISRCLVVAVVLVGALCACSSQPAEITRWTSDSTAVVEGLGFRGAVLNADVLAAQPSRLIEMVQEAESIVAAQIKAANQDLQNQGNGCPVIHENLGRYIRQYSLAPRSEDTTVDIRFLWSDRTWVERVTLGEDYADWDTEQVLVFDGCSHYWSVTVNLDSRTLRDLQVNGGA